MAGISEKLVSEFPNISLNNLVSLHLPLTACRLYQENLVVYRFVVQLNPRSHESQCFLGHAYRDAGDLESARSCYKTAISLAMNRKDVPKFECLDACNYLCYLAETENKLRHHADALVNATLALQILKEADPNSVQDSIAKNIYRALHGVCLGMELDTLAEYYQQEMKSVEARDTARWQ